MTTHSSCTVFTPRKVDPGWAISDHLCYSIAIAEYSGCPSFWGNADNIHRWTRNLCTKFWKWVPMKRNRETNEAFQKHLYHQVNQTIQWDKSCSAMMCAFLSQYPHGFHDGLPHVQFGTCWDRVPLFVYIVNIISMTLHTAIFSRVIHVEICVNVTPENTIKKCCIDLPSPQYSKERSGGASSHKSAWRMPRGSSLATRWPRIWEMCVCRRLVTEA